MFRKKPIQLHIPDKSWKVHYEILFSFFTDVSEIVKAKSKGRCKYDQQSFMDGFLWGIKYAEEGWTSVMIDRKEMLKEE